MVRLYWVQGSPFQIQKTNKKLVFGVSYPVNSSSQGVRALHRLSGRHHPGSWKGREQGKAGGYTPCQSWILLVELLKCFFFRFRHLSLDCLDKLLSLSLQRMGHTLAHSTYLEITLRPKYPPSNQSVSVAEKPRPARNNHHRHGPALWLASAFT